MLHSTVPGFGSREMGEVPFDLANHGRPLCPPGNRLQIPHVRHRELRKEILQILCWVGYHALTQIPELRYGRRLRLPRAQPRANGFRHQLDTEVFSKAVRSGADCALFAWRRPNRLPAPGDNRKSVESKVRSWRTPALSFLPALTGRSFRP